MTVAGSLTMLALAPVQQDYLLEARQMQALSFAVHIPLVCFGVGFPAMVLFVEWLYMRSGDQLYLTLAKRWTKVMVALFAVGVITGTILSFEMGLLWPNFTATFGSVFGLGFAVEGFSFFVEAIFIGIYVYGWDRLSPRAHFASGIPIVISGFTGSLMVISVNAWMNHPTGFRLSGGEAVDVHPVAALFGNSYLWHEMVHMYIAAYIVTGFLVAGAYAFGRLRGRWGRYERTALAIPLTVAALAAPVAGAGRRLERPRGRGHSADQAGRDRRAGRDQARCVPARPGLVHRRPGQVRRRHPQAALDSWPFTTPMPPSKGSMRCPPTTVHRSTSSGSPSRPWSASAPCSR